VFSTILIALLALATLAALLIAPRLKVSPGTSYERRASRAWALVPLTLLALLLALTCVTTVDAKTEGVLLTFKKPSDRVLESGLALKAPWQEVVEVDGTRKTDNFNGGKANDEEDSTQDHSDVKCRLGDNGVATVKASIQWAVKPGMSNRVYEQYRSDVPVEELRDNLVVPRFRDAINSACGQYKPTAVIDALDIDEKNPGSVLKAIKDLKLAPDFDKLAAEALADFEESLGADPLITVEHVTFSYMELPESSQKAIQAFQDEAQKARTALLSQTTNAAQAEANRILSASISNDPFVLVSRCLDLIADGKLVLPAGGSCWPGGGSAVVVPGAK
jgi:regulator of protease activity HflC (stomatin/prohibitin superfamily)